jgi:hypothetical protein
MELYCTTKSQYTTVKNSQQLFGHTYRSNLYGLGTLTPIEFFRQDLLWQSSNTHSHSCSQKASKTHVGTIHRRAIGPPAHHNSTSAHSPSLACPSPDDRMSSPSTAQNHAPLSQCLDTNPILQPKGVHSPTHKHDSTRAISKHVLTRVNSNTHSMSVEFRIP